MECSWPSFLAGSWQLWETTLLTTANVPAYLLETTLLTTANVPAYLLETTLLTTANIPAYLLVPGKWVCICSGGLFWSLHKMTDQCWACERQF